MFTIQNIVGSKTCVVSPSGVMSPKGFKKFNGPMFAMELYIFS
jgi:hypothetical protein